MLPLIFSIEATHRIGSSSRPNKMQMKYRWSWSAVCPSSSLTHTFLAPGRSSISCLSLNPFLIDVLSTVRLQFQLTLTLSYSSLYTQHRSLQPESIVGFDCRQAHQQGSQPHASSVDCHSILSPLVNKVLHQATTENECSDERPHDRRAFHRVDFPEPDGRSHREGKVQDK